MNSKLMRLGALAAVAALLAAAPMSAKSLPAFEAFYVFGDSLADTGNLFFATAARGLTPAIPPSVSPNRTYYRGRFSNGPVAFEVLWQLAARGGVSRELVPSLQVPAVPLRGGVSFAFGGSGTGEIDLTPGGFPVPGVKGQVAMFRAGLAGQQPPTRALYAIFTGANDYLRDVPLDPAESVANLTDAIRALYDTGAREMIVMTLPDLGMIPLTAGTPQSPLLSAVSRQHNALLAAAVDDVAAVLPALHIRLIDVNSFLSRLPRPIDRTLPALDALVPVAPGAVPTSRCLFVDPAGCPDVPTFKVGLRYLFWDAEHPTTHVHALLGHYVFGALLRE